MRTKCSKGRVCGSKGDYKMNVMFFDQKVCEVKGSTKAELMKEFAKEQSRLVTSGRFKGSH